MVFFMFLRFFPSSRADHLEHSVPTCAVPRWWYWTYRSNVCVAYIEHIVPTCALPHWSTEHVVPTFASSRWSSQPFSSDQRLNPMTYYPSQLVVRNRIGFFFRSVTSRYCEPRCFSNQIFHIRFFTLFGCGGTRQPIISSSSSCVARWISLLQFFSWWSDLSRWYATNSQLLLFWFRFVFHILLSCISIGCCIYKLGSRVGGNSDYWLGIISSREGAGHAEVNGP